MARPRRSAPGHVVPQAGKAWGPLLCFFVTFYAWCFVTFLATVFSRFLPRFWYSFWPANGTASGPCISIQNVYKRPKFGLFSVPQMAQFVARKWYNKWARKWLQKCHRQKGALFLVGEALFSIHGGGNVVAMSRRTPGHHRC